MSDMVGSTLSCAREVVLSMFRNCRNLILASSFLWLAACAGGGSAESTPTGPPEPAPLAPLEIRTPIGSTCVGSTLELSAGRVGGGTVIPDWSSSDPSVATIDSRGHLVGVRSGTVTVTARLTDQIDTVEITVVDPADGVASAVLHVNFEASPMGPYDEQSLRADWIGLSAFNEGIEAGRGTILEDGDRFLRLTFPEGTFNPGPHAAWWQIHLDQSFEELFVSYRFRFREGFDFVKGGKLPGLAGGRGNTGGHPVPNGRDGWSARGMWRRQGDLVQYVWHPDQPEPHGEDFPYATPFQRSVTPGRWHHVEHRIVMNDPGEHDGVIQAWFDCSPALDVRDLRFRDVGTLAIDHFQFATFFGGGDATWAATRDEHIDFDDFVISPAPIAH